DFDIRTDLALPLSRDDQLERSPVRLRNRRKGRVNHMNANFRQKAGQLQFLLRREGNARHLLAIAQGIVINAQRGGIWKLQMLGEARGRNGEALKRLSESHGPNCT